MKENLNLGWRNKMTKKIEQLKAELDIAVKGMNGWYKSYEECLHRINTLENILKDGRDFVLSWAPQNGEECNFKTEFLKLIREAGLLDDDNERG
jgi:hypothetical protein